MSLGRLLLLCFVSLVFGWGPAFWLAGLIDPFSPPALASLLLGLLALTALALTGDSGRPAFWEEG